MTPPTTDTAPPRLLWQATWAILAKDVRSELRTRYALNTMLLFAVSTALSVSVGIGFLGLRRTEEALLIQSALLWIALLFAALNGLSRSFVHEEEARTLAALRMAAPPLAVYLGKLTFNLLLTVLLAAVTSLLFIVLLRVTVGTPWAFVILVLSGCCALAGATTLLAAIIARASFKGALFAVIAFPLLVPLLIVAIQATAVSLDVMTFAQIRGPLSFLSAYTTVTVVASLMLFRFVWES